MKKSFVVIATVIVISSMAAFIWSRNEKSVGEEERHMETYYFTAEDSEHEGTWLIWPHEFTYGIEYREETEEVWVKMVEALSGGEKINIVAYNKKEKGRITNLLADNDINLSNVEFTIAKSDDVWARDVGPIFVFDENNNLTIADFNFDGWGGKTKYRKDNKVPSTIARDKDIPIVSIPELTLEGGAVELDGNGTLMACKSSVVSENRNKNMELEEVEKILSKYLGVTNFIWLDGVLDEDITDAHIDGTARFIDKDTILTVSEMDFLNLYKGIKECDYDTLINAKNAEGNKYSIVELPMTKENVEGLDYKGSYLNYYIGNEVVLVPVYNDVNDETALNIIEDIYSDKEIIPIDVTALYQYGGMIHCITQQQPKGK